MDDETAPMIKFAGPLIEEKDRVEEIVKSYFHYLRHGQSGHGVTLLTSLQWAHRNLDPDDFRDLQYFLRDILLDSKSARRSG